MLVCALQFLFEMIYFSETSWKFWKKRRYVVAVLALLGFFNVYSLRVNLSIAIVAMTEFKNITTNGTTALVTINII